MKFLCFVIADFDKAAEMSQASDKLWANPPAGVKMLALYSCFGSPPGVLLPPHSFLAVCVMEAENVEVLFSASAPALNAGGSVYYVPVVDVPVTGSAEAVERLGV